MDRTTHNTRAITDLPNTTQQTPIDSTIHADMLYQIGGHRFLAISGGRIDRISENTIELPCGAGYRVRIEYIFSSDTYIVERIFRRGTRRWVKGAAHDVHAEQLGEVAYMASCYHDHWTI